jgi:hypothetical protein
VNEQITLLGIKRKKYALLRAIEALLLEFSTETGIEVDELYITPVDGANMRTDYHIIAKTEIR